ncbi:MAG: RNA-directed DNA polymerase [Clostridium sp.]
MELNNLYNFKNSIRHFININNLKYSFKDNEIKIDNLAWTQPINFRIRKENDKYRILKIPNVLNFICAYNRFKEYENFLDISNMDSHKRLVANITTGDFTAGEYVSQLKRDFQELCIYDNLIKLDIKSYYERIYTHNIEFEDNHGEIDERYLSNLNAGNTNGIIMGNYISLYFAEKYLKKISDSIRIKLENEHIDYSFSYFSDDFYFFCNKKDNEKIINIFDNILEQYNLERNDGKIEIWTYLEYNNYYVIDKYWKKIISACRSRYNKSMNNNKLYFINQLIYRISKLKDDRQRKVFLNTFFKSTYFNNIDITKYDMEESNYHQLCYIFKFCPETMLYAINKFKNISYFTGDTFKKFLKVRYQETLLKSYNEEQLYYYYVIKILKLDLILKETEDIVVKSNNQILISYYLKDNIFNDKNIELLKSKKDECYWFQNYHLILFTDLKNNIENSIQEYLIPEYIRLNPKNKKNITLKQETYMKFYTTNLEEK